ncbi:MAG: hypothetical protein ABFC63_10720 [Thermoguttaceae bacterium]
MDSPFLPESLLSLLFPRRQRHAVDQAGGELARQCRADVWRRLRLHALEMSPAELRGYARACAGELLAAEAERILDARFLRPLMRERVLGAAMDQVIPMAVRDVLSEPLAATRPMAA